MHYRGLTILSLFLLMAFAADTVYAQGRRFKKRAAKNKRISNYRGGTIGGKFRPYQFVAFGINAMNYYGDLAPVNRAGSSDVSFTRPGFGLTYGYRFHPMASVRANFNLGRLKGDDISSDPSDAESAPRYLRNLSFRNDIKEFTVGVNIYVIPDYNGPNFRSPFNFYIFVGGGALLHEPKGKVPDQDYQLGDGSVPADAGQWVKLRPLGTEGQNLDIADAPAAYSNLQFTVTGMIGATMRLPGHFNVSIEAGPRILFTDYIDDVSTNYVALDQFTDPLARIMSDRSAEPTGVWNGDARPGVQTVTVNYGGGEVYNTGSGTDEIAIQGALRETNTGIRGNPDSNDLYFLTQIKLIYIISPGRGRLSPAKFR